MHTPFVKTQIVNEEESKFGTATQFVPEAAEAQSIATQLVVVVVPYVVDVHLQFFGLEPHVS